MFFVRMVCFWQRSPLIDTIPAMPSNVQIRRGLRSRPSLAFAGYVSLLNSFDNGSWIVIDNLEQYACCAPGRTKSLFPVS